MPKKILFARRYYGFTGGHKKVLDYIQHVASDPSWQVWLYLESASKVSSGLFDNIKGVSYLTEYEPTGFDVIFLAGMDWELYLPFYHPDHKIVNFIQHVRHAEPQQPLSKFLSNQATRLCVSDAVVDAIEPLVNGPVHKIRMGHTIPDLKSAKVVDVYILANKQPELGKQLADWAQSNGLKVVVDISTNSPELVFANMASARVTIALPHQTEGFYLPGIEAMKLSDVAVVPDCIANREYASCTANIIVCDLEFDSCVNAIKKGLQLSHSLVGRFKKWNGKRVANSFSLIEERKALLQILNSL